MSDFSEVMEPNGFFLPTIDVTIQHNQAVSKGDYLILSPAVLVTTGVANVLANAAGGRKAGCVVVALGDYAQSKPGRYRIQGLVRAMVKSGGGTAIVRDMALQPGTTLDLDTDPPTLNQGRWVAHAVDEVAASTSSTASLRLVELAGLPGLGNYGSGA